MQWVSAVEIDIPDDWTRKEIPSAMPPSVKTTIHVVSPDEDAEAFFSVMDVVMSLDEAAESYVRGMAKDGFQHNTTVEVMHNGSEGRHITGSFPMAGIENLVPVDAYMVLSGDSMVAVRVNGADSSMLAQQILGWIDFQDVVAASEHPTTTGRGFWEYAGIALVLGAIGYAIFNSASSRRKTEGQSGPRE